MTDEKDNIINVNFKPLTSLEEYLLEIDNRDPDDIISLVVKDGEVSMIRTAMNDPLNIVLISFYLPALNETLFDLHYRKLNGIEDIDE